MLGSCIIVASLPSPTNLISPHAVLHVSADQITKNLQLLVVDTLDFNSKDGFAFVWKLCLRLFGKSFSYTGFDVGKILLLCIQNTKIITILFIQKLSNHD